MFPYEPLYPANVTVPDAAACIGVPVDVAMSSPVCADLLIALPAPNLDVIIPDTGFINDIPMLALAVDVVPAVFTLPELAYFVVVCVFAFATVTAFFAGSTYSFDIASSDVTKSCMSVSYFSTIEICSIFVLFFSFKLFTTCSASSKFDTYSFSSWFSAIA